MQFLFTYKYWAMGTGTYYVLCEWKKKKKSLADSAAWSPLAFLFKISPTLFPFESAAVRFNLDLISLDLEAKV